MAQLLSRANILKFQRLVWDHYKTNGRHALPWRKTQSPYRILVSELMLQQTQVARVVPKYRAFIRAFPSFAALASAPLASVLTAWQGLGYNRRAKFLHQLAKEVVAKHAGKLPKTEHGLLALPGIGPATAAAVTAFAYNQPAVYLETNVRSVFLHYFFKNTQGITDAELESLIRQTMDAARSREWYWALLDYGVYVKATTSNPNRRSKHYVRQSKFEGSRRQLRGRVIKQLIDTPGMSVRALKSRLAPPGSNFTGVLADLQKEGLVRRTGPRLYLAS